MGTIQETGKEVSQKPTIPSFLITVPTPQEVKGERHKNKGHTVPTYVIFRIKVKTWCISRGDRVVQNVEWIDPALASELIVRIQTLPDININHRRQNCFSLCMTLTPYAANGAHCLFYLVVPIRKLPLQVGSLYPRYDHGKAGVMAYSLSTCCVSA